MSRLPFRTHHLLLFLQEWEGKGLPLDLAFNDYLRRHPAIGSTDRREIGDALFGMVRWKLLIDSQIEGEPTWELRYAVWQKLKPLEFRGREELPLHVRSSFPQELFDLWVDRFGIERAVAFAYCTNEAAPLTVRINPQKTTRDALLARWADWNVKPTEQSALGIRFAERRHLFHLPEYKEGLFEVQDEASQLVAALVQADPGDQLLDYCAGSGGKALASAHRLEGRGQLYLHDVRRAPLLEARRRLARAGVENSQIVAAGSPLLSRLKKRMDWILVDAPCSGSGTLRRNVDQKWRLTRSEIDAFVGKQRSIFEKALSYLKAGGRIVYATCSVLPEENEQQIDHFLRTYSLRLVGEPLSTWPTSGGMDGMFGAVMSR